MALLNSVIDLTHNNRVMSFHEMKSSGVMAIIHNATEGGGCADAEYADCRRQAQSAGLLFGSRHFGAYGDPEGQVDHYLDVVDPTELMVLDFEPNGKNGTMTLAEAEAFVTRLHHKTGKFPGLYSGESFINEQLEGNMTTILRECFLWIAKYSEKRPRIPAAFSTFTLWQYTDGSNGPHPHLVLGVGRCHRNRFNGDEAGLRRLFGQS